MRFLKSSLGVLAAVACLTGCAAAQVVESDLAITNVTIIDPGAGQVLPNQTVLIDEGVITAIRPAGGVRVDSDDIVDGAGRYLIPGLMDMHVHLNIELVLDSSLKLMIANGVTGIRDMGADCWEPQGEIYLCLDDMRAVGEQIEAGERVGPTFHRLASAFVQSDRTNRLPPDPDPLYTPMDEAGGAAVVAYLDERGVDLVKVYHAIFPAAFDGLMAEADRRGLEVSGHVPLLIGAAGASNAGVRTLEHANEVVVDCSDYTVQYRGAMNAMLEGVEGASWPPALERLTETVATFNPQRCAALMDVFAANQTYYVPTHGTREMDWRAGDPEYREDPRLRYVGQFQYEDWMQDLDRTAGASAEVVELYGRFYAHGLAATRIAHERGAPLMMGTDANDTMILPGFAVHDELARFVQAGLTPMEALQTATTAPAEYLGLPDQYGSVAEGYRADLVLLDANPLEDIRNTTDISAVIFGGRHFDREALDGLLDDVEEAAASDRR